MCIFAVWRGMTQNAYPKTAYGNAEMRTLRLHIKLRTVRGFTNKKSANSLKVSGFLNKKCVHLYAFRGERGIRTPGASQHAGFQDRCIRPLYHLSFSLENWLWSESGCKGNAFFRHYQIFPLLFFDIDEYLFCREFKHAAGVVFFQRDVEPGFHQEFAADYLAVKIAGLVVYLHVDFLDSVVL